MLRGRQFSRALRSAAASRRANDANLRLLSKRALQATLHAAASSPAFQTRALSTSDHTDSAKRTPKMTDEFIGKTGAEIFHETLADLGVDVVFGYPGGAILPVFDAIHESKHFDFILTRHEQGAGHMAQGYARATGKPGVVLVTSGPGATNTVTPLQDALMDGTPMVVFSGQVATAVLGSDAFQEADILGITRPCTKWNVQVRNVKDLARNIREAFHIATTGRPGPVLVDLPKDITAGLCKTPVTTEPQLLGYYGETKTLGNRVNQEKNLAKAIEMINKAKKPVIYSGAGANHASEELRALARQGNIPVTTSLQGMGAFDERDPLSLHMLGMHGSVYANKAIQDADVIIAIGARFDDRVTGRVPDFAPEAKRAAAEGRGGIIHFEISGKQVGKIVTPQVAVIGDTKYNLQQILPKIESKPRSEWHKKLQGWKARYPFRYRASAPGAPMKAQRVIEELYTQTKGRDDVIISTGVGQHQMWAAQFYRWSKPNSIITSGGLGTMGFGLPAAIGAKVAKPNSLVVDIDGDASFAMTLTEMATAAQYGIGVKVMILNNDFQGMVKQWQDLFYEERYSATAMKNPDFVKFAESMHCEGIRCSDESELEEAMAKFLAAEGPIIGEFLVEKHEHCYPMVGAGRALDEMIIGDFDDCPPTTSV
jgi:acetolactate synthase-1/2/3 large subunit